MFDIGFWELVMIGVVALVVIGPERLPGVARTTGLWVGKARRTFASVKADIEQEIRADELRRIMQQQAESSGIHELIEETRATVDEFSAPADYAVKSGTNTDTPPKAVPAPAQPAPKPETSSEPPHGK